MLLKITTGSAKSLLKRNRHETQPGFFQSLSLFMLLLIPLLRYNSFRHAVIETLLVYVKNGSVGTLRSDKTAYYLLCYFFLCVCAIYIDVCTKKSLSTVLEISNGLWYFKKTLNN